MKKCENCKKIYDETIKGSIKKYCSKKCGRQAYYQQNKEKEKKNCAKWYQKNRLSEIEKNKEYRKINKELFDWYHNKKRFNGMREIILSRDNYRCRACPSKENLVVHHIDGTGKTSIKNLKNIKTNNDINNLICLCHRCHMKIHWWQKKNNILLTTDKTIIKKLKTLI